MFAQSVLSRIVLTAAAGALVTTAAAGAAAAGDPPPQPGSGNPVATAPGSVQPGQEQGTGQSAGVPAATGTETATGTGTAAGSRPTGSGQQTSQTPSQNAVVSSGRGSGRPAASPGGIRQGHVQGAAQSGRMPAAGQAGGSGSMGPHRPARHTSSGTGRNRPSAAGAPGRMRQSHDRLYQGRVVSRSGLLVRSAPNRRGSALGRLLPGQLLWVKCRMKGEQVGGNAYWYKLADGRWTWASARYIATVGGTPRVCR